MRSHGGRRRLRVALPLLAAAVIVVPMTWMWQASRLPAEYSVMDMGYVDYGGGPRPKGDTVDHAGMGHGSSGAGPVRSVADLTADPNRVADVRVDLTARQQDLSIGGRAVPGYTLNGSSPGPTITATQGQLIEVRATNASVAAGIALHWHGIDVPNAMDGVAGVTQDAVRVGQSFTYRFVADQTGTYWYHSHQVSHEQVVGGLFGALVVKPRQSLGAGVDVTAQAHTYDGIRTVNGRPGDLRVPARPRQQVRLRIVNTDNAPMAIWATHTYRLLATDGSETRGPTPVTGQALLLTAGGRADLGMQMPADGSPVRVQLSSGTAVVLGSGDVPAQAQPTVQLDLLSYGSPAPLGFDPDAADRRFEYNIGRRPGFIKGRPGMWWTINGHLYPNVPMYVVRQGDVVRMSIRNSSGQVHPMHLHGHHAVVLSRNGVAASGSPWIVDSLNVANGETYEIAFVADNPGVWMDHCHNLKHARDGMVAHLMYEDVRTPYRIGGPVDNQPE